MKIPDRIWLQYYGDSGPDDLLGGDEPSEIDVSWSSEKIFENDIEYVRAASLDDEQRAEGE